MSAGCPDEGTLAGWAAGGPTPEGAAHLRGCGPCSRRLAELRDEESFARRFAVAVSPAEARPAGADASPELPGYAIRGEIGRGGQGVVYLAMQQETRRSVAIKTVLLGTRASQRQLARFEREVEIAASLRHPNIVTVYEARSIGGGRHALVMEHVDGVPLLEWRRARDRSGAGVQELLRERAALIRDAARAVEYAHGRGVIHRDLKPANILVDATGQPRILDFGLARRFDEPAAPTPAPPPSRRASGAWSMTATFAGEFQGTPAYAAPEQFEDDRSVDVRADVYALGVILLELATGRMPFGESGDLVNLARLKRAAPGTPAGSAGLPRDLTEVIAKAAAPDRDKRYPSARALAEDLDAYLAGGPVSARTGRLYRLSKFVRRRRVSLAIAAAAAAAAGIGLTALVQSELRARSAREFAELQSSRYEQESARAEAVAHLLDELLPVDSAAFNDSFEGPRAKLFLLQAKIQDGAWSERPLVRAGVSALLAKVYEDRGVLNWANVHRVRVLGEVHGVYGDEHPETAEAKHNLAALLLKRSDLEQSLALAEEARGTRERTLGPAHQDTGRGRALLAQIRLARGELGAALGESSAAVEILGRAAPGSDALAEALRVRAEVLESAGDRGSALGAARRSLQVLLGCTLDEDPRIAAGLRTLGRLDEEGVRWTAAAADLDGGRDQTRAPEAWARWVEAKSSLLGPNHPGVARTLATWARVEYIRWNADLALSTAERAAAAVIAEAGQDARALCDVYELEGQIRHQRYVLGTGTMEAEVAPHRRRVEILERTAGKYDQLELLVAKRELGDVLLHCGRYEESRRRLLECLPISASRGSTGVESARVRMLLALTAMACGEHAEAHELALRAYLDNTRADPGHIEVPYRALVLGMACVLNGDAHTGAYWILHPRACEYARAWYTYSVFTAEVGPRVLEALRAAGEVEAADHLQLLMSSPYTEAPPGPVKGPGGGGTGRPADQQPVSKAPTKSS